MCLKHNISPSNGILLRGFFTARLLNNPLATRFLMNLCIHYNSDKANSEQYSLLVVSEIFEFWISVNFLYLII